MFYLLLNSCVSTEMLKIINPTIAFQVGDIKQIRSLPSANTPPQTH